MGSRMTLAEFEKMRDKWRADNPHYQPTVFKIKDGYKHAILFGEYDPPKDFAGNRIDGSPQQFVAQMPSNDRKGVWFLEEGYGGGDQLEPWCVPNQYITTDIGFEGDTREEAILRNQIKDFKNKIGQFESQVRQKDAEIIRLTEKRRLLEEALSPSWPSDLIATSKASDPTSHESLSQAELQGLRNQLKSLEKQHRKQGETIKDLRTEKRGLQQSLTNLQIDYERKSKVTTVPEALQVLMKLHQRLAEIGILTQIGQGDLAFAAQDNWCLYGEAERLGTRYNVYATIYPGSDEVYLDKEFEGGDLLKQKFEPHDIKGMVSFLTDLTDWKNEMTFEDYSNQETQPKNPDLSNSMTESQVVKTIDQEASELHKLEMAEVKQRQDALQTQTTLAAYRYCFYQTLVRWVCGAATAMTAVYCLS